MMISLNAVAQKIEVFTTKDYPVALNGHKAFVCLLDTSDGLEAKMNEQSAFTSFQRGDKSQSDALTAHYRCMNKANRYELQSLPAIVVDETYVTYGLRTVDKALMMSAHFKKTHHD